MSRAAALIFILFVAGCGDYPSGSRACPRVAYDERCAAYADAEVDRALRCDEVEPADAEGLRIVNADWYCGGDWPADVELAGLLAADRIRYDARETGCVVERLRDLDCAVSDEERAALLDRIRNPLVPATPVGAPCTDSIQCIDSFCPAWICGRTCTPFAGTGEPCGVDAPCGPGELCDGGRCGPKPGLGERCEGACAEPLACLGSLGDGARRCFDYVWPGEPCDEFRICPTGCVDMDPQTGVGTCGPRPGVGDACAAFDACGRGLVCDLGGTRTCVSALHPGDPCDPEGTDRCLFHPIFWCSLAEPTCHTLPGIGEACEDSCRLGVCLDGRCAWPEPATDVPCTSDWNCGDDRVCDGSRCVDGCR